MAKGTAFDVSCLAVTPNTAFTVDFNNQDAGVPHNVDIYKDPGYTQHLAGANGTGDTITGPNTTTYSVQGLPAGTYYFRCDIHPTLMTGVFVVAKAGGGGGASASPTPAPTAS